MKKLTSSLIAAGVIAGASMSAPAMAEGPSGNVSIVSNYVWRGDTQTGDQPAVQGGLDWEKDKFAFGVWGSAVTGGSEIDVYGSYNFGPVTAGAIYYYYPGQTTLDFYEVNVGGDVGPVSLMASYNPDCTGCSYYLEAGYSFEVAKGASLDLHVGQAEGATLDYSVGVATSAAGLDLGATYANKDTGVFFVSVGKSM
jgi:uncharacterized protein (TIGR02001 family)